MVDPDKGFAIALHGVHRVDLLLRVHIERSLRCRRDVFYRIGGRALLAMAGEKSANFELRFYPGIAHYLRVQIRRQLELIQALADPQVAQRGSRLKRISCHSIESPSSNSKRPVKSSPMPMSTFSASSA